MKGPFVTLNVRKGPFIALNVRKGPFIALNVRKGPFITRTVRKGPFSTSAWPAWSGHRQSGPTAARAGRAAPAQATRRCRFSCCDGPGAGSAIHGPSIEGSSTPDSNHTYRSASTFLLNARS